MMRKYPSFGILLGAILICAAAGSFASFQVPSRQFPFTAEENADGARYVWFIYGQSGSSYDYLPAKMLPTSKNFRPASGNKPQLGDVAWWKEFVAIYVGDDAPEGLNLVTAEKKIGLKDLEKKYGPVTWYRFWIPDFP